ncbi:putative F-box domain, leucine-rich repeat domain superfamily, F-box-like domain superfamily [Helianthus debilis subsp. tardiflorus]
MGDRKRMNIEGDRLSSLPDDLIHKILSFVSIKSAVETSVLSPRWRYIWTSMPYLNFSTNDFPRMLYKFSTFVEHVLSGRDNQIKVSSVDLTFIGTVRQKFVTRIMKYAFSHNVQQLNITCLSAKMLDTTRFHSRSLKHFTLTGSSHKLTCRSPTTWKMQALATLNLYCVTLHDANTDKCVGFFSTYANLKDLTIKNCKMEGGLDGFNICHAGLTSLTLEDGPEDVNVNVDTPQLKNLNIKQWRRIHLISTPNLSSLHYKYLSYN